MTDQAVSAEAGNAADTPAGAALLLAEAPAASVDGGAADDSIEAGAAAGALVTDADRAAWLATLPEPARALAQTKGWGKTDDILQSYTNLEKLVGTDKLPVPKDDNDKEGYERIFKALGRPDTADGYKLPVPDGSDGTFAKTAAEWFHEAGLGEKQAVALTEKFNGHMAAVAKAETDAFVVRSNQDMGVLKTEWGDQFESNLEMGRRAARQFGLSEDLGTIERALGTKKMLGLLAKIGGGLAEDTFEAGDAAQAGFKMTPSSARARIEALKGDQAWQARWMNGGADEKAEWNRLQAAANPAG